MKGGYLYLFERITKRSWKARLTGQREIKIGISKKPVRRLREVDKAVEGVVVQQHQQWFDNPRSVETKLHKKFKTSRFTPRAKGKGGGLTEWFLIDKSEYQEIRKELRITNGVLYYSFIIGVTMILVFWLYVLFFT